MVALQNIGFGYGKKALFENLDLELNAGSICGVLGKNGAGKTTLMKIIVGLLFPKNGTSLVMGYQPSERHPDFLSDVYFVPEELYAPKMKVSKYMSLYAPFYPRFDEQKFTNGLKEFEVEFDSVLTDLSYGQKKKVILAFGLATNCKLLVMDEPTNGLDIPSKSQFRKMMARSIEDDQIYLISTHQVKDLSNLIDSIVVLDDHEIIFHEKIPDISRELFFGFQQGMNEPENILHAERTPGGFTFVKRNEGEYESEVDMEILFNTIIKNKSLIQEIFKK